MPLPVSSWLISDAERKLGVSFPPRLRARLARANGGDVECSGKVWRLHPVRDLNSPLGAASTESNVRLETMHARTVRGFPADAVAVASGVDGDLLILRGDGTRVEIWSRQTHGCTPADVDWDVDLRRACE